MGRTLVRALVFVLVLGAMASAASACELMVQLDRSGVDGGGDAPCNICSDVTEEEDDAGPDAPATAESGPDARDAGSDGAAADSGTIEQ